jgi:HAD superfamily hydrolase (TIGR01490 family)
LPKSIAFFDFDGTITTKDTMLELIRFTNGTLSYYIGMAKISPWLIAMKLKLISKASAKEKLLSHFYKNMPVDIFNEKCKLFSKTKIPALVKQDALATIKDFQDKNIPVVIVSASAENWVIDWCNKHNIQCIATKLLITNNKVTGKLYGGNCNGNEKVSRIKKIFNLADFEIIYCYGDTSGDKAMLAISTNPHYKKFIK